MTKMMTQALRAARLLVPLALLGAAAGNAVPPHGLARAQSLGGVARYTSAAYGYTLLAPASWARVPGVRWTPAGPRADLTLMPPDHQAALGVIVTPTGSRRYSDAELRSVALRLLYQENYVIPTIHIQQQRVVINGVAFQTVASASFSGAGYTYSSSTFIRVWVTQRYNRLYAIAGLVYLLQGAPPPPPNGLVPTPTPEGGLGLAPGARRGSQDSGAAPAPVPLPTAGPVATTHRVAQSPTDPPAPLPTDHPRGNRCPSAGDGSLIIRDKNCAAGLEQQLLTSMAGSFSFTPRASTDRRPAAEVGVDGFATATDSGLGLRLEYPTQWSTVSVPNTNVALQSDDQTVLVTLQTQRTDAEILRESDLQSVANAAITQVSNGPPPSYQTLRVNGVLYVQAFTPVTTIKASNGGLTAQLAQVSLTVASYHHRLYGLRAISVRLPDLATETRAPGIYPYFSPFTTLARLTQSAWDLQQQGGNLAVQTTLSLYIDPRVPEA